MRANHVPSRPNSVLPQTEEMIADPFRQTREREREKKRSSREAEEATILFFLLKIKSQDPFSKVPLARSYRTRKVLSDRFSPRREHICRRRSYKSFSSSGACHTVAACKWLVPAPRRGISGAAAPCRSGRAKCSARRACTGGERGRPGPARPSRRHPGARPAAVPNLLRR